MAGGLGELAADAGDWDIAAEAWEQAARAAAIAIDARVTRGGRFDERSTSGNVFRWAAYALIRAGAPERGRRDSGAWPCERVGLMAAARHGRPGSSARRGS